MMARLTAWVIWISVSGIVIFSVAAAVNSPLLAWREPTYIIAGLAGVVAMTLLLLQPTLAGGYLSGLNARQSRQGHRVIGFGLVVLVIIHVAGLWITSPPDVIDALLFASPTPFSIWGVIAMWAVFLSAIIVTMRRTLRIKPRVWRRIHTSFALIIAGGTILHALLIEGTMEPISKMILCILIGLLTARVVLPRWMGR